MKFIKKPKYAWPFLIKDGMYYDYKNAWIDRYGLTINYVQKETGWHLYISKYVAKYLLDEHKFKLEDLLKTEEENGYKQRYIFY